MKKFVDKIWVSLGGNHFTNPSLFGGNDHDCALRALYWAAPWIPERDIKEAFEFCTESWPYAGVTNKEFSIVLKYLGIQTRYDGNMRNLGYLLNRGPKRCVALIPWHFVTILDKKIVREDRGQYKNPNITVYCRWEFD